MWHLVGQYISGLSATGITVCIILACVLVALWILNIIAFWKVFEKAGEKGWKTLIPIYNVYIMFKIAWAPKAFLNLVLFSLIYTVDELLIPTAEGVFAVILPILSFVAFICAAIMLIAMSIRMSKSFGHGVGFGLGLYFLSVPFTLILGLGKSQYTKPAPDPRYEKN